MFNADVIVCIYMHTYSTPYIRTTLQVFYGQRKRVLRERRVLQEQQVVYEQMVGENGGSA